jgi:hypothetical protein
MLLRIILACLCVVSLSLAVLVAQGSQADSPGQQPTERQYDRFKDQTTVKLKPQTIRRITRPPES